MMKEIPEAVVCCGLRRLLAAPPLPSVGGGTCLHLNLWVSRVPGFQGSRLLEKGYTVCISALNGLNVCSNCNDEVDKVLLSIGGSLLFSRIDCADELFQVTCAR
jgi:hypothetical protein